MEEEIGVYIHIPFCKQKCFYCDFCSFSNENEKQEDYMKCVKKELQHKIKNCFKKISTIYIGGGTPSYINSDYITEILNEIQFEKDAEITIEVNPGTVTEEKLRAYKAAGINRLSIGLQTTNDVLLKQIGRIHNFKQFLYTYNLAREIGFENMNIDLMIGLPSQTIDDIKHTLEEALKLELEHISVYSLILEEGTILYDKVKQGKVKLPSEDDERHMYWYVKNKLELNGYVHYEISNFAKPGKDSKHNINCWKQKEYIGIGVSASSYESKTRYSNIRDLDKYIQNVNTGNFDANVIIEEVQNKKDEENEFMLLGLRMINGVCVQGFKNKFGENPIYVYKEQLDKLVQNQLVVVDGNFIRLSNKGLDLANQVWQEFV